MDLSSLLGAWATIASLTPVLNLSMLHDAADAADLSRDLCHACAET